MKSIKLSNSSGKVITVFLVILSILLVTLAGLGIFFTQVEKEKRIEAEELLEAKAVEIKKFEKEISSIKKKNFLLDEKYKEADDRINEIADELELERGLREEMKIENAELKEKLDKELNSQKEVKDKLSKIKSEYENKIVELEAKLKVEIEQRNNIEKSVSGLQEENIEEKTAIAVDSRSRSSVLKTGLTEGDGVVDLKEIVVIPDNAPKGRVLSVDSETDFVIVNLGQKDGVKTGQIMSVYRGKKYLGDVKVTRVQPEMAAADIILPFSSSTVRKNDTVVVK